MCDNFCGGAADAPFELGKILTAERAEVRRGHEKIWCRLDLEVNMVEELEQEYAGLKDKVRDLREYL